EADERADLEHIRLPEALAEDVDRSRGREHHRVGHLQQRRLTGAVGSQYDPTLVVVHRPGEVIDDMAVIATHDDVVQLEHTGHALSLPFPCGRLMLSG